MSYALGRTYLTAEQVRAGTASRAEADRAFDLARLWCPEKVGEMKKPTTVRRLLIQSPSQCSPDKAPCVRYEPVALNAERWLAEHYNCYPPEAAPDESWWTSEMAGVPMWGWVAGAVVLVGGAAVWAMTR